MRKMTEEQLTKERVRLSELRRAEAAVLAEGYDAVLGVDEVGRGPLCGPVVTACCVLPESCEILYLNDSKKLSEKRREALYDEICEKALAYGFGMSTPERIDEINILQATFEAMREAVEACRTMLLQRTAAEKLYGGRGDAPRCIVLVDGDKEIPELLLPQHNLIKGDAKSASIAAASILAKVKRDRMMYEYDRSYPQYDFAANKGYGTKTHVEALLQYGPTEIHRRSFLKKILGGASEDR